MKLSRTRAASLLIAVSTCYAGIGPIAIAEEPQPSEKQKRPELWQVLDVALSESVGRTLVIPTSTDSRPAVGVRRRGLPKGYQPKGRHIPVVIVDVQDPNGTVVETDDGKFKVDDIAFVEIVDVSLKPESASVTFKWYNTYHITVSLRKNNDVWTYVKPSVMGVWRSTESKDHDSETVFSPDYRVFERTPHRGSSGTRYFVLGDSLVLGSREVAVPMCRKFRRDGDKLFLIGGPFGDMFERKQKQREFRRVPHELWADEYLNKVRSTFDSIRMEPAKLRLELNYRRDGKWMDDQRIVLQTVQPEKELPNTIHMTLRQANKALEHLVDQGFFRHAAPNRSADLPTAGGEIVLRTGDRTLFSMTSKPGDVKEFRHELANLFPGKQNGETYVADRGAIILRPSK